MPLALYMDQHVPRAITTGLRLRNVDVLTAFEDGCSDVDDPALLDRATALGRALFSQDDDLLRGAPHSWPSVRQTHRRNSCVGDPLPDVTPATGVLTPLYWRLHPRQATGDKSYGTVEIIRAPRAPSPTTP